MYSFSELLQSKLNSEDFRRFQLCMAEGPPTPLLGGHVPKVHRDFSSQKHRVQEQRAAWLGVGMVGAGGMSSQCWEGFS